MHKDILQNGGVKMLSLILTCDLGTTSCKTTLFTSDGEIKNQSNVEYKTYYPKVGWAEQDADDWWGTAAKTIRECVEKLDENYEILCISLSSQRETFVPVDRHGRPLARAISWLDRRNTAQTEELIDHFGRSYLHNTTGMIPYPNFTSTKLLWMKQNALDILKQTYKILQPRDYIYYKLTGKYITDYSLASRTMMLNMRDGKWDKEIMDYVGVKESLMPDIYYSHESPGVVSEEASTILGIKAGIPVVVGGGDRCCEALGSGITGTSVMESTATAGNISYVTDKLPYNINEKILCTSHVIKNKWLMEQGLTTTGSVLRWFRDNIYYGGNDTPSYSSIDREIEESPIGSNKLLMLPFFMGARSSRFNPYAKGTLFGLDLSHKRGDIGRSIMEGVAFEVKACIDILTSMGMNVSDVVLMGGGAKADVWNSIKADVYNMAIKVPKITEASSFGAFLLGCYSVGIFRDAEESACKLNYIVKEFKPVKENSEIYMKYYEIYNELYSAVEGLFKKLDDI